MNVASAALVEIAMGDKRGWVCVHINGLMGEQHMCSTWKVGTARRNLWGRTGSATGQCFTVLPGANSRNLASEGITRCGTSRLVCQPSWESSIRMIDSQPLLMMMEKIPGCMLGRASMHACTGVVPRQVNQWRGPSRRASGTGGRFHTACCGHLAWPS